MGAACACGGARAHVLRLLAAARQALLAALNPTKANLERVSPFDTDNTVLLCLRDADARVFYITDHALFNVPRVRHAGALCVTRVHPRPSTARSARRWRPRRRGSAMSRTSASRGKTSSRPRSKHCRQTNTKYAVGVTNMRTRPNPGRCIHTNRALTRRCHWCDVFRAYLPPRSLARRRARACGARPTQRNHKMGPRARAHPLPQHSC